MTGNGSVGRPLAVGDVFHEFARGAFGRDHYNCSKVEAAGPDWIVVRTTSGGLDFAAGRDTLELLIKVRDENSCPNGESCRFDSPLTSPGGC